MTDVETPTIAAMPPVVKEENAEVDSDDEDLFNDNGEDSQSTSAEKPVATVVKEEDSAETNTSGDAKVVKSENAVSDAPVVPSSDTKPVESSTPAPPDPVVEPSEPTTKDFSGAATGSSNTFSDDVGTSDELDTSKPIPRKSSVESSSGIAPEVRNDSRKSDTKYFSGASFGLDAGVRIPHSVDNKLLEGAILSKMKSLPPNLTNDALQEYDDALLVKGSNVRNRGAYLMGVLKRYVSVQERAKSGEGPAILPMGEGLTPLIHSRLDKLVATGFCSVEEMNDKVKSKIRMLSEKDALFAIDELASAERSTIRNFGSYFMGILNRYMRGDKSSRAAGEGPSNSNNNLVSRQNRFDRNKNNGNRGSDRNYRDGRNGNQHPRERSRERFEDQNIGSGPYGPSYHTTGHYGPSSGGNGRFGPGNRQQTNPPYADPYSHETGMNSHASWQQHQQNPSFPPGAMGNHNSPMGSVNMGNPPPPPPVNNSFHQNQIPSSTNNQFGQQPPPRNNHHGQQQSPPFVYPPQQNPPLTQYPPNPGQSQFPPHGGPPPPPQHQSYNMPTNNSSAPQNNYQHQGPPQQNQFVQNNNSFNTGISSPANPHQQGSSYGGWQQQRPPQQQLPSQNHQGGLDILALADKASSALANVNTVGQPQGGASPQFSSSMPGYRPPPPPLNHPNSSSGSPHGIMPPRNFHVGAPPPAPAIPPQHSSRRNNNRHTTAKMEQLPIAVQYAVQNLVATGHVEKPPDEGILGMIVDLPENMALQALQKFCSIDKSSMRSRTGYLIGLLRRELEKINKR